MSDQKFFENDKIQMHFQQCTENSKFIKFVKFSNRIPLMKGALLFVEERLAASFQHSQPIATFLGSLRKMEETNTVSNSSRELKLRNVTFCGFT